MDEDNGFESDHGSNGGFGDESIGTGKKGRKPRSDKGQPRKIRIADPGDEIGSEAGNSERGSEKGGENGTVANKRSKRQNKALGIDQWTVIIAVMHSCVGTLLQTDTFDLSEDEAREISKAFVALQNEMGWQPDSKATTLLAFLGVVIAIESRHVSAFRAERKQKRLEMEQAVPVQMSQPGFHVVAPSEG